MKADFDDSENGILQSTEEIDDVFKTCSSSWMLLVNVVQVVSISD